MKPEHTKEPWMCCDAEVLAGDKSDPVLICECDTNPYWKPYGTDGEFNARRIVACVNACAGIPTEALEKAQPGIIQDSLKLLCEKLLEEQAEITARLKVAINKAKGERK